METIKDIASTVWTDCKNRHRLYPYNNHTFSDYWGTAGKYFEKFTLLESQPTIATTNTEPESVPSCGDGWISVKDQLPELAKQVCITLEMDGNARAAKSYPGFRANGGWYVFTIPDKSWVPHDDKHYKITHWQPLPKAPL